jgi:hypothetical protein
LQRAKDLVGKTSPRELLAGGFAVMFLMGLFPPWYAITPTFGDVHPAVTTEKYVGHGFLFHPPKPFRSFNRWGVQYIEGAIKIDFTRLLVQWAMVAFVLGGALLYLKDRDKKQL